MTNSNIPRLVLSVKDALLATGWTRNRLYKEISSGNLPSIKNGRRRFIRTKALTEFLARLEGES
jgi:hypothetical protein